MNPFGMPHWGWYYYTLPLGLVSTVILFVGVFIFVQNPKSATNRSFFFICLCVNSWLYGNFLVGLSHNAEQALTFYRRVTFLGVSHVATSVYFFSTIWLKLSEKQKKLIWGGFAGSAFFYLCGLFLPVSFTGIWDYYWGFYPHYGPLNYVFLVFFFSYFLIAFYNFIYAYRNEPEGVRKTQIRLIAVAFLIALMGSIDYIPKLIHYPVYPIGYWCVFTWIMMVAYSIIKYKVMDIQTAIHKTLMWLVSSAIVVAPFAIVIRWLQPWVRHLAEMEATVLWMVFSFAFYFYFRSIQPIVDHLFQRRKRNLQNVLSEFSKELVHLKSLRDLLQGFVRMIRRTFYVRRVSVYLLDKSGLEFHPAIVKRVRGLKPVAVSHPFLKWLEQRDIVVVGDLVESDPTVEGFKDEVRDYFVKTEASVVVPFVLGGKLIGITHLGPKDALRKYLPEEIQFLNLLKSPVTIAFSNSMQFIAMQEKLQEWNEELEKKVTERTLQLEDTQAQLVQAEKLATVGTFAGGIAHEINNPLTAVLTNAQILKMDAKSEDDIETISLIEEGAKRCQIIIQKLLKYTRQPGKEPEMKPMDLAQVIQNVLAILKYQMMQENIEIVFDSKPGSYMMRGVSNELEQVLTNLLLNARDAIREAKRKGKIVIGLKRRDRALEVTVKDNGVGIKKEIMNRIFDPFFTTKQVGAGTGLGLAVSHSILQKHQCHPLVESEEGAGSTFTLVFPEVL